MKVQGTVKKETFFVAVSTAAGSAGMLLVFLLLHSRFPEQVPFDYRVPLSAFLGAVVATADFFLMGLTVQEIVSLSDQEQAIGKLRVSYRYRTMGKLFWLVLCMVLPCFVLLAGFVPLLIPSVVIKARGILSSLSGRGKEGAGDAQMELDGEKEGGGKKV